MNWKPGSAVYEGIPADGESTYNFRGIIEFVGIFPCSQISTRGKKKVVEGHQGQ